MNKLWLALIGLLMSYGVYASNYKEGVEFITRKTTVQYAPKVVEFFSFYCPHCYQFKSIYNVSKMVEKNLPKNIKMVRYHVNFLGPLGSELTKAWTAAIILKIEDKVSSLLFHGIQKTRSIQTHADIKDIFIKAGIKNTEYDIVMNSTAVKLLVIKQQKLAEDFKLCGVPAIFVNGKYMIRSDGIYAKKLNNYSKVYSDVVNFLIHK